MYFIEVRNVNATQARYDLQLDGLRWYATARPPRAPMGYR
jgi:hypothetical protein